MRTPTQVNWWLAGERGRVGISITLTPQVPPMVQVLNVTSVRQPSSALESAARSSLNDVQNGRTEFSTLLLPIRHSSWVECDGARRGSLLIEGAALNVQLQIDLDETPIASYHPAS